MNLRMWCEAADVEVAALIERGTRERVGRLRLTSDCNVVVG